MGSVNHNILSYPTYFFDCDGVLLDSNRVKSEAFYLAAVDYGEEAAQELVKYNSENGGVSRQEKFHYFFDTILGFNDFPHDKYMLALERYAEKVREGLAQCAIAPGAREFLESLPEESHCFVVSGGEQNEVKWALEKKDLARYFTDIYGNPDDKMELVRASKARYNWKYPALFFGDARYDHVVAQEFDMDFIFMLKFSEYKDARSYVKENSLFSVNKFDEL
ncbi:HAD family hydrolase [Halomonas salipaludis]|uniref:HAD family hydrolase n=1 Tax=Halomonas salipaludis TaxID=2032625 RepID=A0A2A2F456_9GAMM|nr:HAD hydrolase-like protein [Halomonas salipaludis]PAU79457.1 hypothetical protein CK498_03580 [Halomonas salipaludis]